MTLRDYCKVVPAFECEICGEVRGTKQKIEEHLEMAHKITIGEK